MLQSVFSFTVVQISMALTWKISPGVLKWPAHEMVRYAHVNWGRTSITQHDMGVLFCLELDVNSLPPLFDIRWRLQHGRQPS